jgi:4-amino-4-deoxy-L-arabinose transferase-like glycosyltransferase
MERWQHRGWHYLLLIALALVLFFVNLGGATLWDLDEGRNATAALEMMESGNWIVPTFNAKLRVDKPALIYWLQIAAYRTFGVSEFSARLPSALAALLTVLVCYELARSMFGRGTGILAGVIVASTPMLCGAARFANPDALLNLFTALTLTLFWLGKDRPGIAWYASIGAAAGLAVLAKGPVGVVLPGAVIGLYLLWERRLKLLWDWRAGSAFWAMLLVAAPWYIWVAVDTKGEFIRGFILNHNVDRFRNPMENHTGSPAYYLVVLLVGLAPWSIFLGPTLWYGAWSAVRVPWRRFAAVWEDAAERDDSAPAYRLLACWAGVYVLFFSAAATKLPNYVLPVAVPCAVLTARFLERWRRGELRVPRWVVGASLASLLLIGVGTVAGLLVAGGVGPADGWLRGRAMSGLEWWAALGVVPLAAAAVGAWCVRRQRRAGLIAVVGGCAVLLVAPLAAFASALFNGTKPARPLVEAAGAADRARDLRVGAWHLEHLPSLNFYLRRDVTHFQDEAEIDTFLRYPVPVFVFLPAEDWERLAPTLHGPYRLLGRHRDLYHNQEVVVVSNR